MSVVIAGSNGLVGIALTKCFRNAGFEVLELNRSVCDLLDPIATNTYLRSVRPSLIINAAARVGGIAANNRYPVQFLTENLQIQHNLMSAAFSMEVERFIFLGSSCIYPRDCAQPIKEEYLLTGPLEKTNSAYALAKIAGIELINSYRKQYGLKWISLMPTNLYGPHDNFNLDDSHVLPALIRRFVEASESDFPSVSVWGSGSPLREFLHVDDFASAVLLAYHSYDSPLQLNIGTGEEVSIQALASKVASAAGFQGKIDWDLSKPDGTPRKVLDATRIKALGWRPTINLEEGIKATIEWYRFATFRGEVRK